MRTTTSFTALDHIPDPLRPLPCVAPPKSSGLALVAGTGALALALLTWSVQDPSLNHATDATSAQSARRTRRNHRRSRDADAGLRRARLAGAACHPGAGGWSPPVVSTGSAGGWLFWFIGSLAAAAFASILPVTSRWPLPTGLGGVIGDAMLCMPRQFSVVTPRLCLSSRSVSRQSRSFRSPPRLVAPSRSPISTKTRTRTIEYR